MDTHEVRQADRRPPAVPTKRGPYWNSRDFYDLVWACADLEGTLHQNMLYKAQAWLRVISVLVDGTEEKEIVEQSVLRRIRPGETKRNVDRLALQRVAQSLANILRYGRDGEAVDRLRGLWVVHWPSGTKTWLPVTPYTRTSSHAHR